MEDNKEKKVNVSTILFIISLIIIIVMAISIFKLNSEKNAERQKVNNLQAKMEILEEPTNNVQEINHIENETLNDDAKDRNQTNGSNVNKNKNPEIDLGKLLDNIDFSNSLTSNDWEITSDGKTIKKGDTTINTNLSKEIKSFEALEGQAIDYLVLTNDGEVYYAFSDGSFELFGKGYNGISGFTYNGQVVFVAKSTSTEGTENPENTYTFFTNKEQKIVLSNGI